MTTIIRIRQSRNYRTKLAPTVIISFLNDAQISAEIIVCVINMQISGSRCVIGRRFLPGSLANVVQCQ